MKWTGLFLVIGALAVAGFAWQHWWAWVIAVALLIAGANLWAFADDRRWQDGLVRGEATVANVRLWHSHNGPTQRLKCDLTIVLPGQTFTGWYDAELGPAELEILQDGATVACAANDNYPKRVRLYPHPEHPARFTDFTRL